ncbi:MAG: hypothetical protein ACYC5N_04285 [Endomicrobiales bacterium]
MKQSYRNVNLIQRKRRAKAQPASMKWLASLKKTGGMARKLRRDGR